VRPIRHLLLVAAVCYVAGAHITVSRSGPYLVDALALTSASVRSAAPGPIHIEKLTGSLVRLGTWGSGANGYALYGVRLRTTVCLRSAAEARKTYPSEITITHFAVGESPRRWWPARTVIDRAPWLVPFGESWHRKRCGPVVLEDPIPSDHRTLAQAMVASPAASGHATEMSEREQLVTDLLTALAQLDRAASRKVLALQDSPEVSG
jgi:hypothetical protein